MSAGPTESKPANHQHLRRNPPILGEAEAIAAAQAGDEKAFETLYALHKRRVYSLCLRMLGNVAAAEDLTQDAFLQLYRKIGTFRGDSAFSTWLHRLAVNVVLMHLRKKGLPQISIEEALSLRRTTVHGRTSEAVTCSSPDRSTALHWNERLRTSLPATAWSSCCTTWKATNITRSPTCFPAP
jgi:RNA polymerase sigma factor (sigma-70 family)